MGRHSAPDDDEEQAAEHATVRLAGNVGVAVGRHEVVEHHPAGDAPAADLTTTAAADLTTTAAAAAVDHTTTVRLPHVPPAEPTERAATSTPAPTADVGTHADLRLLRENPTLRARCVAAVIVPFVLYTVVLVVVGRLDLYLLWVWIPTVVAGVVAGSFLDAAHRRAS
jgi:hypothetical protein